MFPRTALLSLLLVAGLALADSDGHVKLRGTLVTIPADSLLRQSLPAVASDAELDLRLNLLFRHQRIRFEAAGQLFTAYGDLAGASAAFGGETQRAIDDARRAMDLTHSDTFGSDGLWVARLDRLVLGWHGDRLVVRVGRQALSWGGGLFYSPLDLVNPFDPAVIDAEYKAGDDVVYAQYLFDDGSDLQFAEVLRRNPLTGSRADENRSSLAKYRGFAGAAAYDLVIGRHYGESVFGVGLGADIGGTAWRTEVLFSDSSAGGKAQALVNASRALTLAGRNATLAGELYFNGFGLDDTAPLDSLPPALLARLARGDLFASNRRYAAAALSLEWSPLTVLSAATFVNLDTPAAFLQLGLRHSLAQESEFQFTLSAPLGGDSEYRGLRPTEFASPLSRGARVFLQYAHYF